MRLWLLGGLAVLVQLGSGCSSVPGDAALRSGHPDPAAKLYQRGAQQGDAAAALRLGFLLDQGLVSAEKYGEAGDWFKKGCSLGNLPSCHNAGVAYEEGKNGFAKNHAEAQAYYLKAATAGYMQSQYNLASLYSNGYVTPSNDVEGLKWMLLSQAAAKKCSSQGLCQWILEDPPGHKRRLESRLSNAQQQEAALLAKDWKPAR